MMWRIGILLALAAEVSAFNNVLVSFKKENAMSFKRISPGYITCPMNVHGRPINLLGSSVMLQRISKPFKYRPSVNLKCVDPESKGDVDHNELVRIYVRTEDIEFDFIDGQDATDLVRQDATDLVTSALFHDSDPSDTELSIVLCSDVFIQGLNKQWRDKDKATDVLSFPQEGDSDVVLGDLVVSIPTAMRQVLQFKVFFICFCAETER
jgi:hypothetical protein